MECGPRVRNGQDGAEQTGRLQKTRGFATTSGPDYEVALCCLFYLRALRLTSDFFLFSNLAIAGNFDDVVLFYRLKEDQCLKYRAILLQAKHKEKTTEKKLTANYPFRLQEYLYSIKDIRNLWEQSVNVESKVIEFMEVSLVLYTNTGCAIGDTAHDVTTSPEVKHLHDFLNTGGRLLRISEGQSLGLPQGRDSSDFLRHLILCTEQMSVETADQFLEEEIRNVLGLTSLKVVKELKLELTKMIKDWWSKKGKGRCLTATSDEWKKVLRMQLMNLNTVTLLAESQLNLHFTEEALEKFKSIVGSTQSWISVRDEYQATATKVRLLKALRSCLVLDAKFLESKLGEVEVLWGTVVCPTLALDMSAVSPDEVSLHLQRLKTVIHSHAGRHLVVIAKGKPTEEEWVVLDAEATWSVLDPATQQRLLGVQVELQGTMVTLRDVVGSDASSIMSEKVIKSLCDPEKEEMKLGTLIHEPLECYVPRCVQRKSSSSINFHTLKNMNTLIFPENKLNFMYNFTNKLKYLYASNLKKTNHIVGTTLIKDVCSYSEIRKQCFRLHVRGFSGTFGNEGLEGNVTEFLPFTWMCEEKVVVVEGVPGVGKSSFVTAMCSSVKEQFPESWVLRLDIGKHSEFIKETDFRNASDITAFLLSDLPKKLHGLEQDLLEHSLYVTGNVFLFLDGYDEISPDFTAKCCHLLKAINTHVKFRQMVVTTRPITSREVEKALGTKAFSLPVFSEEEQTLFLEIFCKTRGKNVEEEEISSLRQSAGSVLEIPLLCKMAAEVLLYRHDQNLLKYKNPWRKVLLYKLFVEQSINNRIAEKWDLEDSKPGVKKLLESNSNEHLRNLQALAVRKLMPVGQLCTFELSTKLPEEKLGLIIDNGESVDFEHQTFCEYFLGCWLARHWQQCHKQLLCEVLYQNGNELVAATFSMSLFEDFPLHVAVAQGDEVAVRQLLSSGTSDRGGRSALHVAAMTQGRVGELLVGVDEDINIKDEVLGATAVKFAEIFRNWEFIEVLLEKGKKLESLKFFTDKLAAEEVLIQVIEQDLTSLFQFILQLHEEIFDNIFDNNGTTFLHIAAANNSTGVAKVLIEMCYDVNLQDSDRLTPLHLSSTFNHKEAVRLLLANGADPNIMSKYGDTALMQAAFRGHLEVVKLLIEQGDDSNIKNINGNTALKLAAAERYLEVVNLLIEKGADPNIKNINGVTALMLAADKGHLEVVKILIEKRADPNIKDINGITALMQAAGKDHLEVAKLLIEKRADPNIKDRNGNTALILAAAEGHLEVVKLLIEKQADPNINNINGVTSLMLATAKGHLEIVKLLIEKGADPNIKNINGNTALIREADKGHLEVVKLLIEKRADPNIKDRDGNTALMLAAAEGHLEVVKMLLEKGADPNTTNVELDTALMWAAFQGHLDVVKLLLHDGADPNMKNENGKTALMIAGGRGHQMVVELLEKVVE